MKKITNSINILIILTIIPLIKFSPPTMGGFTYLVGINILIIIVSSIISIKLSTTKVPMILLICLVYAIVIKIKYFYFVSQIDLDMMSRLTDYFYRNYILIYIGSLFLFSSIFLFIIENRMTKVVSRFSCDLFPGKHKSMKAYFNFGILTLEEWKDQKSKLQQQLGFCCAIERLVRLVKSASVIGIISTVLIVFLMSLVDMYRFNSKLIYNIENYSILMVPEFLTYQFIMLLVTLNSCIIMRTYSKKSHADINFFKFSQASWKLSQELKRSRYR